MQFDFVEFAVPFDFVVADIGFVVAVVFGFVVVESTDFVDVSIDFVAAVASDSVVAAVVSDSVVAGAALGFVAVVVVVVDSVVIAFVDQFEETALEDQATRGVECWTL